MRRKEKEVGRLRRREEGEWKRPESEARAVLFSSPSPTVAEILFHKRKPNISAARLLQHNIHQRGSVLLPRDLFLSTLTLTRDSETPQYFHTERAKASARRLCPFSKVTSCKFSLTLSFLGAQGAVIERKEDSGTAVRGITSPPT